MQWIFGVSIVAPANAGRGLTAAIAPLSFTPSYALAAAAFMLGPALVIREQWRVLCSAAAGVVLAWAGSAVTIYLGVGYDFVGLVGVLAWHVGVLGAPLALAWRVRARRKLALCGRACLDCGYDLAGVTMDRCPECGARRHEGE